MTNCVYLEKKGLASRSNKVDSFLLAIVLFDFDSFDYIHPFQQRVSYFQVKYLQPVEQALSHYAGESLAMKRHEPAANWDL